uniref:Uncharacterized protein n=1 Tax=Lotharella globosa TaxID=91324 RepID=A0A7S4DXD2_9EUKA
MSTQKQEESIMDIVKEHGTMTFLGLGGAILVGKELFMVNEEVVILGLFSGVCFYGYVTLVDDITASMNDYAANIRNNEIAKRKDGIVQLENAAETFKDNLAVTKEIQVLYDSYEETMKKYVVAQNLTTEQAVVTDLEAQLQDLYDAKNFVSNYENTKVLKMATEKMEDYVATGITQKEKDNYFKWAVSMLEGKAKDGDADFITAQFKKEIETASKAVASKDPKAQEAMLEKMLAAGEVSLADPALKSIRKICS